MSNPKKSYRKLFAEIAESKSYKIKKPTFHQRKNSIDIILEGQTNGKPTEVTVDIKKKNSKSASSWVYLEFKIANC